MKIIITEINNSVNGLTSAVGTLEKRTSKLKLGQKKISRKKKVSRRKTKGSTIQKKTVRKRREKGTKKHII